MLQKEMTGKSPIKFETDSKEMTSFLFIGFPGPQGVQGQVGLPGSSNSVCE